MIVNYALDVNGGFFFNPGLRAPVGYLTTANFFGTALSADMEIIPPIDPTGAIMHVVAVMSNIQWGGTTTGNLSVQAYVSAENQSRLRAKTQMALTNTALTLNFTVYANDPALGAADYFPAFAPQQPPLHAVLARSGGTPEFTIANSPFQLKDTVPIYEFSLAAAPPPNQMQYFKVAASSTKVTMEAWGI